ncbi:sensor histidine kinase [Acidobacteriota bacterium]
MTTDLRKSPEEIRGASGEENQRLRERVAELQERDTLNRNLIYIISHDLQNPLTGIQLDLEMIEIREKDSLPARTRERFGRIGRDLDRIQQMLSELLDINRLGEGRLKLKKTPCHLIPLIEEKTARLSETSKHRDLTIKIESDQDQLEISADSRLFNKLLQNLLDYALRSCDGAASLTVRVDRRVDGWIEIEIRKIEPGAWVRGAGKTDRHSAKTEKPRETDPIRRSLALMFSQFAARAHGGRLEGYRDENGGLTFTILWPPPSPGQSATEEPTSL